LFNPYRHRGGELSFEKGNNFDNIASISKSSAGVFLCCEIADGICIISAFRHQQCYHYIVDLLANRVRFIVRLLFFQK
jgi:hypothetical protein